MAVHVLLADIKKYVADQTLCETLFNRVKDLMAEQPPTLAFDLAKVFYSIYYGHKTLVAVDYHGTPLSLKLDLNHPIALNQQFNVCINNGTAEHIFNTGQVFKTMHEWTLPGGLMIHEGPLISGWIDHGFVNFQPTIFFDLARTNQYEMRFYIGNLAPYEVYPFVTREEILTFVEQGKLPSNATFLVFFRKPNEERPFSIPVQGYYDDQLSEQAAAAWHSMR